MSGHIARQRVPLVVVLTIVMATALPAFALAGHLAADVPQYTGCLSLNSGNIVAVAEGPAPKSPCNSGQVQIHFSGGDITGVTAGVGLEGGGQNGAVGVAITESYRLPQTCAAGQVTKWGGSAWTCATDNDTTYTGDDFALSGQDCSTGQLATGVDGSGALKCVALATPPEGPEVVFLRATGSVDLAHTTGVYGEIGRVSLGPGKWIVQSTTVLVNGNEFPLQDNRRTVRCSLRATSEGANNVTAATVDGFGGIQTVTNLWAWQRPEGFEVTLGCETSEDPNDLVEAFRWVVVATRAGSIEFR